MVSLADALLLEPGLHLVENLWRVPHNQAHAPNGRLEQLDRSLVKLILNILEIFQNLNLLFHKKNLAKKILFFYVYSEIEQYSNIIKYQTKFRILSFITINRRIQTQQNKDKRITNHSVDGQELIATSEATVLVGHAALYDARNVDRGMLLAATHHIEAQALGCLGQLDDARVRMTLRCRKRCHRRLKSTKK